MALERVALLAVAGWLATGAPVRADDEAAVQAHLVLQSRFTVRNNAPQQAVLLDPGTLAFQVQDYLRPGVHESYLSGLLSAGLEGRALDGRLRWAVSADTGEVRRPRLPSSTTVCGSGGTLFPVGQRAKDPTPTGLALPGSGRCNAPALVAARDRNTARVETTAFSDASWTSNGRPLRDELEKTLLLREAWLGLSFGRADFAAVRAGRKRITVGDGYVFDDYATGIEADLDLGAIGPQWDLGLAAFYPTRDFPAGSMLSSPMVAVRADWLPSLFEHAGLFAAARWDQTGGIGTLFRGAQIEDSALQLQSLAPGTEAYRNASQSLAAELEAPLSGTAFLAWGGTSGSLGLWGGRLGWTGALVAGHVTLQDPTLAGPKQLDGSVLGQLASIRYQREILSDLRLGGFFLFLSGDLPPIERSRRGLPESYGGFLGVAPFVTETNLFFEGGTSESFSTRQASAPGVNGRGVIAPGLTASWEPSSRLRAEAKAAYLLADEVGPYGGLVYGPELDLNLSWSPAEWIVFRGETDVLWPGDFFRGGPPEVKVVLGVDLLAL